MKELEMERELVLEMVQEEPVAEAEHPPIEIDPVADFEKARRAAMEAHIRQLNEELSKTTNARMEEKQERDLLKLQLDTVQKEKEEVSKRADEDMQKAADKIYKLRRKIDAMWNQMNKPILWPFLTLVGFVILSVLIGMAVDHALVVSRLGEPVGYICISIAAFFGGIIWERLGGGICGRKRVCNSKLGAGRDRKGCGDCC